MYDELDLDMLGDERTALFLIMSDTDGTFAFLISLIYSILFNRLCERADDVYGGRLATVYKGNIIKNLIMDCQSYTKYRPNETTGGIFVSWRRKEELPTGA